MKTGEAESAFLKGLEVLPKNADKIVIALSGGADSVCLTELLASHRHMLPPECALSAVYVNHGLNPDAASWGEFCRQLCANLQIPFRIAKVHVDTEAGLGIEAAARISRYEALTDGFTENSVLATAHHANDQAETVLLALKRGAGVQGMSAMAPISNLPRGRIWRPLLGSSRAGIEKRVGELALGFVTDGSNADTSYDRNYLRHEIVPKLCSRFGGFLQAAGNTAAFMGEAREILLEVALGDLRNLAVASPLSALEQRLKLGISAGELLKLSKPRQKNALREFVRLLSGIYPSANAMQQTLDCLLSASVDAVPQVKIDDWSLRRFAGKIFAVDDRELAKQNNFTLDAGCTFRLLGRDWQMSMRAFENESTYDLQNMRKNRCFFADAGEVVELIFDFSQSNKLNLCCRDKSRELKKIFAELGVPPWLRKLCPLVRIGGEISGIFPFWPTKENYQKKSSRSIKFLPQSACASVGCPADLTE